MPPVISLKKSKFVQRTVDYLGHILSPMGLQKQPFQEEAIWEFLIPTCVRDIQRFHGRCQWYANFIPNFADKAQPLYQFLKKGEKWKH